MKLRTILLKKISIAKNKMKKLYNIRKSLTKRLKHIVAKQTKYYNKKHKSMSFFVKNLMFFSTKIFKQKRLSKKMFSKFAKSFRVKNKINSQIYRLILSNNY